MYNLGARTQPGQDKTRKNKKKILGISTTNVASSHMPNCVQIVMPPLVPVETLRCKAKLSRRELSSIITSAGFPKLWTPPPCVGEINTGVAPPNLLI